MVRNINTTILTLLFLGTMFGGLFNMTMGMDMAGGMSSCPFMTHESTLCAMSAVDHVESWKSAFLATIPGFVLLLALIVVVCLVKDTSFFKSIVGIQNGLQVCYTSPPEMRIVPQEYSYLRQLFSSGIIHTKIYSYTA